MMPFIHYPEDPPPPIPTLEAENAHISPPHNTLLRSCHIALKEAAICFEVQRKFERLSGSLETQYFLLSSVISYFPFFCISSMSLFLEAGLIQYFILMTAHKIIMNPVFPNTFTSFIHHSMLSEEYYNTDENVNLLRHLENIVNTRRYTRFTYQTCTVVPFSFYHSCFKSTHLFSIHPCRFNNQTLCL